MNDGFWKELQAVRQMQEGLASALQGKYVSPQEVSDPLLARINGVCEQVQRERPRQHLASSLINPSPSRSPEINTQKVALAREIDALLRDLAAPASLVAEVLRVYGPQAAPDEQGATRAVMDTATVTPPIAEVRTFQQAVDDRHLPQVTIPAGSPLAAHLQSWIELSEQLHGLYAGMDELAASEAFVLRQENAEAVDALLGDGPVDETWDGEVLDEALTLHDLRSGEVQVLDLTDLEVNGPDWVVRFAEPTSPLPLLGKGEVLRLVTTDGALTDDIPHRDLEFREGILLVLGVEPAYLELLRRLSVRDVQQLALLHYGHAF